MKKIVALLVFVAVVVSSLWYQLPTLKRDLVERTTSLANLESLANPEDGWDDGFVITCSSGWYGECQRFELYICNNGNQAAHCIKTGDPEEYCNGFLAVFCTILGMSPHP